MIKKNHLLCEIIGIPTIFATATSLSVSSCSQHHTNPTIFFVDKSTDYVTHPNNAVEFTFKINYQSQIQLIDNVSFLQGQPYLSFVQSSDILVNDDGTFSIGIIFTKNPLKILKSNFSLLFQYTDAKGEIHFERVESSSFFIIYDYRTISLDSESDNPFIVNDDTILCKMVFDGANIPQTIENPAVNRGQEWIKVDDGQNTILINQETHKFEITFKLLNDVNIKNTDKAFDFDAWYSIDQTTQQIKSNLITYKSYDATFNLAYQPKYVYEQGQKFSFYFSLSNFDVYPQKIDKIRILNPEDNSIRILHSENILINKRDKSFCVEAEWYAPITGIEKVQDTLFSIDYCYDGICVINQPLPLTSVHLINEPEYTGTKVSFFALEDGTLCLHSWNQHLSFSQAQYSINGGPSQYLFEDSSESPYTVSYSKFDRIEIWSDKASGWVTSKTSHSSLLFSGEGILSGDITALLDNEGGNITEFGETYDKDYLFYKLFATNSDGLSSKIAKVNSGFFPCSDVPKYGFAHMFDNDSSLEVAPELPATSLHEHAYDSMFLNCTSLREIDGNTLPAVNVPDYAYYNMFCNCNKFEFPISIESTSMGKGSFSRMFLNCSALKDIRLKYTGFFDIYPQDPTFYCWVLGVSEVGNFYYKGVDFSRGISAIPENWNIILS